MLGIYCRVSTKDQEKGTSLPMQEALGQAFAKSIHEPCRVYSEARSGGDEKARTEWKRLKSDIETGGIHAVWSYRQDRMARNDADYLAIRTAMKDRGIRYYPAGKLVDWEDEGDELAEDVQGVVAKYVRNVIRKRTQAAITELVSTGRHAPRRLIGYSITSGTERGHRRREVVPEQAELVRRVFELFNDGTSIIKITDLLNGEGHRSVLGNYFSRTAVRNILENPRYAGLTPKRAGWWKGAASDRPREDLISSAAFPAIVERRQWEKAQTMLTKVHARGFSGKATHMSTGILRCGVCGRRYQYNPMVSHGRPAYSYVHTHDTTGNPTDGKESSRKCEQRPGAVLATHLDAALSVVFLRMMMSTEALRRYHAQEMARLEREQVDAVAAGKRLDALLSEKVKRRENLLDAIEQGTLTAEDARERMEAIRAEIEKITTQKDERIRELRTRAATTDKLLMEYSGENVDRFMSADGRTRRDMLARIVKSATITARDIEVETTIGVTFRWHYQPRSIRLPTTLATIASQGREIGGTKTIIGGEHVRYGTLGGVVFPMLPPDVRARVKEYLSRPSAPGSREKVEKETTATIKPKVKRAAKSKAVKGEKSKPKRAASPMRRQRGR